MVTNARDAMPDGGEIRITADFDSAAAEVCLKVSDDGMGISELACG